VPTVAILDRILHHSIIVSISGGVGQLVEKHLSIIDAAS
jgi:hypothetical protein